MASLRAKRWRDTTTELDELRRTAIALHRALGQITEAAEAAGWDVDGNAVILDTARDAHASARPVIDAILPEVED